MASLLGNISRYKAKGGDKFRIVAVEWDDSATRRGWQQFENINSLEPAACRSIGVLLESNSEYVKLAGTWGWTNGDVLDTIAIPQGCVRRITEIKWPRKKMARSKTKRK